MYSLYVHFNMIPFFSTTPHKMGMMMMLLLLLLLLL
jgi:hypothetical protein